MHARQLNEAQSTTKQARSRPAARRKNNSWKVCRICDQNADHAPTREHMCRLMYNSWIGCHGVSGAPARGGDCIQNLADGRTCTNDQEASRVTRQCASPIFTHRINISAKLQLNIVGITTQTITRRGLLPCLHAAYMPGFQLSYPTSGAPNRVPKLVCSSGQTNKQASSTQGMASKCKNGVPTSSWACNCQTDTHLAKTKKPAGKTKPKDKRSAKTTPVRPPSAAALSAEALKTATGWVSRTTPTKDCSPPSATPMSLSEDLPSSNPGVSPLTSVMDLASCLTSLPSSTTGLPLLTLSEDTWPLASS
mmetsp:Transcript_80712/g.260850  ORF Transcript_80712/g.260850 Transcript_80712/m.260850 type:complete len:307 (-) Transcript_80712:611-1531(-)